MVSERKNESYLVAIKADLKDINPVSFGEGFIQPGHKSKIFSQSCTLLFYSRIGEGTLILNGNYIPIRETAFFIVPVGSDAYLYSTVPWKHQYIGFTGTFSHDFVALPTVFTLPEDIVSHLYVPEQETRDLTFRLLSDLCIADNYAVSLFKDIGICNSLYHDLRAYACGITEGNCDKWFFHVFASYQKTVGL